MSSQSARWLRAHRPVLEELHDVQESLREHALDVARAARTRVDDPPAVLDSALDRLQADCERLSTVCRVLTHCVPPPNGRAADRFRSAVAKLSGAAESPNLGRLVTEFEDGCADFDQAEAVLVADDDQRTRRDQSGT